MDVVVRNEEVAAYAGPAVVVAVPSGEAPLEGPAATVDAALDGLVMRLRRGGEIKGGLGNVTVLHTFGRLAAERVVVAGLGEATELTVARLRRAAACAARAVYQAGLATFASTVFGLGRLEVADATQAIVEGTALGLYRFDTYRASDAVKVQELAVLRGALERGAVDEGVRRGREVAAGVTLARDLINEPPNVLTPGELARRAQELAGSHGLECRVLDAAAMRELGMNALLGVASGSDEPPAFIVLRYGAAREGATSLGLIGKGITFDSGGISIKPAENMHEMKGDMGGAAAVLGAMRAIAGLGLDLAVTAVVPATENLPGSRAQVPGDVVRAMNGVTIEVINTDAEGRLILADALSYAVREGLSPLVDVATLTGACNVALGPFYTGVFGNDDGTATALLDAARRAGEQMWRMPLDSAYEELIKSDVADIKNSAGRTGGAITAAMFLQHFVGETPWVHLDIAPTSWSNKDEGEQTKGGSGVAVRTLVALAEALGAGSP
jgi:leucyl aminopeptidase